MSGSRALGRDGAWLIAVVGSLALTAASASCADSPQGEAEDDAGGAQIPAPSDDAGNAGEDGACDAGRLGCASPPPTCDDGAWCPVTTPLDARLGLAAVWGTSKTDVWAVGAGGTILHFDGSSWTMTNSGTTEAVYAIWGSGPTDLWAVSSSQTILRGAGWQSGSAAWHATTPLSEAGNSDARGKNVRAVWGTSATDVMLGGESFAAAWRDPPVNRWRASVVGGEVAWVAASDCVADFGVECPSIHGLWGASPSERWAVGTRGHVARSTSSDGSGLPVWGPLDSQSTADLESVWGSGPGDIWAVGERGTIRHYVSGAERLAIVPSPTNVALRSVWGSTANDVWAVGDDATVLHFDGSAWTAAPVALPAGQSPHLRGVWGSTASDVWAVGNGVVLHFTGRKAGQ